jgi:phage terminase large subunit GpA-like protein
MDYTSHLVHYGWMGGKYEDGDLEEFVNGITYPIDGQTNNLPLYRVGIDTGGGLYSSADDLTMTAAAYEWIRKMRRRGLFGTKGSSWETVKRIRERPIDKMPGEKEPLSPEARPSSK